jgi:hypothetical protein
MDEAVSQRAFIEKDFQKLSLEELSKQPSAVYDERINTHCLFQEFSAQA